MLLPHQQFRHAQNMAGDVMDAFAAENRSRVAQAREQRRMAHERQQAAAQRKHERRVKQQDLDSLLERIGQAREEPHWTAAVYP